MHVIGTLRVHEPTVCAGYTCSVHNPSMHHMREWAQNWREARGLMERLCVHGVGHPDPDHLAYVRRTRGIDATITESTHGCDGCCHEPGE